MTPFPSVLARAIAEQLGDDFTDYEPACDCPSCRCLTRRLSIIEAGLASALQETPAREGRLCVATAQFGDIQTICGLPEGHTGEHVSPESRIKWSQSQETPDQTVDAGKAFCAHCAWHTIYEIDNQQDRNRAELAMREHAQRCPNNPLVATVLALTAQRDEAKVQAERYVELWRQENGTKESWKEACFAANRAHNHADEELATLRQRLDEACADLLRLRRLLEESEAKLARLITAPPTDNEELLALRESYRQALKEIAALKKRA